MEWLCLVQKITKAVNAEVNDSGLIRKSHQDISESAYDNLIGVFEINVAGKGPACQYDQYFLINRRQNQCLTFLVDPKFIWLKSCPHVLDFEIK